MDYNVTVRGPHNESTKGICIGTVSDKDIGLFRKLQIESPDTNVRKKWEEHKNATEMARLEAFAHRCGRIKSVLEHKLRKTQEEHEENKRLLGPLEFERNACAREMEQIERALDENAKTVGLQATENTAAIAAKSTEISKRLDSIQETVREDVLNLDKTEPNMLQDLTNAMNDIVGKIMGEKKGGVSVGIKLDWREAKSFDERFRIQQALMYQESRDRLKALEDCRLDRLILVYLKDVNLPSHWLEVLHAGANRPELIDGAPVEIVKQMLTYNRELESLMLSTAKRIKNMLHDYQKTYLSLKRSSDAVEEKYYAGGVAPEEKPTREEMEAYREAFEAYRIAFDCYRETHALVLNAANTQKRYNDALETYLDAVPKLDAARKKKALIEGKISTIELKDRTVKIASLRLKQQDVEKATDTARRELERLKSATEDKEWKRELHQSKHAMEAPAPFMVHYVPQETIDSGACSAELIRSRAQKAIAYAEGYFDSKLNGNARLRESFRQTVQALAKAYVESGGNLNAAALEEAFGGRFRKLKPIGQLQFAKITGFSDPNYRLIIEMHAPNSPVLCYFGKRYDGAKFVSEYDRAIDKGMEWLFPRLFETPRKERMTGQRPMAEPAATATAGQAGMDENTAIAQESPAEERKPNGSPASEARQLSQHELALAEILKHKKAVERLQKLTSQLSRTNTSLADEIRRTKTEISRTWKTEWHQDWEALLMKSNSAQLITEVARMLLEQKQLALLKELAASIVLAQNVKMDDKIHLQLSKMDGTGALLYEIACMSILKIDRKIGDKITRGSRPAGTETDRLESIMNILASQGRFEEIFNIARKAQHYSSKSQETVDFCNGVVLHAKDIFEVAEMHKQQSALKPRFREFYSTLYPESA